MIIRKIITLAFIYSLTLSSMTLFASVSEGDSVFQQVIDSYFNGDSDDRTIDILKK